MSSEGLQVKDVIEDMVRVRKASLPRVSMSHPHYQTTIVLVYTTCYDTIKQVLI